MATRLKPSRINVDNTPRVGDGAAYQNDNDFHWSMGGGDMSYKDFEWHTLTGTSLVIEDISNNITPSSNFTVSAGTVKPGIEYVLRVNTGNTAYTMTLGTGVTNPNGYSTDLQPNTVNQFTFIATSDSQLELEGNAGGMTILSYGNSTWSEFISAYKKNAIVYCRASSNSNPATGSQTRLAFMAYVNNADNPTEVEFQYYRSRSSHGSDANQQDEVYVYKLTNASGGTWTVTPRDTAAKIATGTGLTQAYTTSGSKSTLTIANDGVLTVNGANGTVTVNDIKQSSTAPANPTAGTAWYDTTNGALKVYNGSAWDTIATGGAISDTAYGPGWDGQTTTAPSQNAVYDKISAMDTTISGKQDTLVSGTNIKTINNETLLGSGDISINGILSGPFIPAASATYAGRIWFDTMNNKFWKCDGTTWTEVTPVLSVNGGTGAITVNDVKVSATAPSSPTEGMVWYDTTNDQLKVYDGSQWNVVGDDTANINTKTFYLTPGSSATARQKGQECYDWYKAGNNPIVSYNGVNYHLSKVDSTGMLFKSENDSMSSTNASVSTLQKTGMVVQLNGDTVIGVSSTVLNVGKVLATDVNYSTVYTPQYDGSPATKKYVDDAIAGVGGGIEVDENSPIQLTKIRAGTQTEYDNLSSYDSTTVYLTI